MSIIKKSLISADLNAAIKIIGDDHVLCIISILGKSPMRFNDLQRSINNINPTTLADRLKKLEQKQMINRKTETLDKLSVVYELTDKGRNILPIVKEIENFAKKCF